DLRLRRRRPAYGGGADHLPRPGAGQVEDEPPDRARGGLPGVTPAVWQERPPAASRIHRRHSARWPTSRPGIARNPISLATPRRPGTGKQDLANRAVTPTSPKV